MKRTQFVGSKITDETKSKLEDIAKKKDWTVSHLINRILEDYSENTQSENETANQVTQHIAQKEKKQD